MSVKILTEQCLEFLSLKGGCTGSYESTLVKMPHCRKARATAQIILNLNQLFRRCSVKRFYFYFLALIAIMVGGGDPFFAILAEGIMGYIHVKLLKIWTCGSGDNTGWMKTEHNNSPSALVS